MEVVHDAVRPPPADGNRVHVDDAERGDESGRGEQRPREAAQFGPADSEEAARQRFGVTTGEAGIVYTRTGRRFFNDPDLERRFLLAAQCWQSPAESFGVL